MDDDLRKPPVNAEQAEAELAQDIRENRLDPDVRDTLETVVGVIRRLEEFQREYGNVAIDFEAAKAKVARQEAKLQQHGLDWDDIMPDGPDTQPRKTLEVLRKHGIDLDDYFERGAK